MVCLYCGSKTSVVNSRHQKKINQVWRRRLCLNCGALVTTLEKPLLEAALRVEHQKSLHPFDSYKLFVSIYESCKHRPYAVNEAKFLTDTVISRLSPSTGGVIDKRTVAETALGVLKRFDKAAAVHYRAYNSDLIS